MQVNVSLLDRSRLTADGTHLPLRRLALCLDCDECFEVGCSVCPACGSRTWSPLARFIDLLSEPRTRRLVGSARKGLPGRAATADKGMPRYLLVVARHQREFYDAIQRAFAGHETVRLILDRRVSQRRQRTGAFLLDRRRSDRRRTSSAVDEQLRTLGWSLVPLDVPKSRRA